ncbi:MAG: PadR family transcriptional regulator [Cyclobacteriaceae bacterium]
MYSKELLKGTLEIIILKLLNEHKELYGYEICQMVKKHTNGKILLKFGSLYPLLHKMVKDGKLSFREEARGKRLRKYYFLTEFGITEKDKQLDMFDDFVQTMENILTQKTKSFAVI